jgi:membrane dipeptidase
MRALFLLLLVAGCASSGPSTTPTETAEDPALRAKASALAQRFIIVDGHIDVPYRMTEHTEDITQATEGGDFDYPRAKAGGLNAPFMSIYIPSARQQVPGSAKALADSLIDLVEGFVQRAPDKFAIAYSVEDVLHHDREGLVSLPMGMENGAPIETLADLRHFHARGIRYITLTHGRDNQLSDSSYDTTATWNGISPFGEQVIAEMNRLGILVDVSHLSDSAFYDVVRLTKAPVMASHSSCRAFTPGWQRNMSDDMIRRLAQNGGVIMINFGSSFLRGEYQAMGNQMEVRIRTGIAQRNLDPRGPEAYRFYNQERRANPVGTLADVVAHIDHVVQLVGIDHVGLGSDFDGVFALPKGLQDISEYPNLVYALLQRGYSEADIGKILGGNALRVWREAEQVAQALQRASGG